MSQDIQLPDVGQASELLDRVYADAFFSKMAEYGYTPRTEADAVAMLETAAQTDQLPDETEKVAADSTFVAINSELSQLLAGQGLATPTFEDGVKQAAFTYATDANIYKSVLALKAAQAEALAQEATSNKQ